MLNDPHYYMKILKVWLQGVAEEKLAESTHFDFMVYMGTSKSDDFA